MPNEAGIPNPAGLRLTTAAPAKITYPDYKATDDFVSWLSGFSTRVASAYGIQPENRDGLKRELLRLIPGKLALGEATDAYERLTPEEKADYGTMVARLKEEFTDPRAEKRFNENMSYNKRKKGQSVKAFMHEIKKDMKRYSDTPATIYRADGSVVPNPEREKQGVRRFIKGIRDIDGKEDEEFSRNLRYQLPEKSDKTWAKVIKAAIKYEASLEDSSSAAEAGSDDDDDDESGEEVESVESKKKKKKETKKKKPKSKSVIAALSDQVHENQMCLTKIETAQERLSTAHDQHGATLQEISAKLDVALAQGASANQFRRVPTFQLQQQRPQQPRSQQQQLFLQQQQRQQPSGPKTYVYQPRGATGGATGGAAFRANPAQNTWSGKTNQVRQGNYGFNCKTPTSFPTAAATAPKAAAAIEEADIPVEDLGGGEEEEDNVTMTLSQFMSLTNGAGADVAEEEAVAAIADLNFY